MFLHLLQILHGLLNIQVTIHNFINVREEVDQILNKILVIMGENGCLSID